MRSNRATYLKVDSVAEYDASECCIATDPRDPCRLGHRKNIPPCLGFKQSVNFHNGKHLHTGLLPGFPHRPLPGLQQQEVNVQEGQSLQIVKDVSTRDRSKVRFTGSSMAKKKRHPNLHASLSTQYIVPDRLLLIISAMLE